MEQQSAYCVRQNFKNQPTVLEQNVSFSALKAPVNIKSQSLQFSKPTSADQQQIHTEFSMSSVGGVPGMPGPDSVGGVGSPGAASGPIGGPTAACVSRVELSIRCNNLLDMDLFSKSDPMVVVYMQTNNHWIEKGRTETIVNCLNPEFSRRIGLDYHFEEIQRLRFDVHDIDNAATASLSDDDYLGSMECTLGQIVSSGSYTGPLLNRNGGTKMGRGTITVYAEEVDTNSREILLLSFKAVRLENKHWFSKSSPFLEMQKLGADKKWQMIHRTEVIPNNLNPLWKRFEVRQQTLGGINVETPIRLVCFNHRSSGNHDYLGEAVVSLAEILDAQNNQKTWPCVNEKRKKQKGDAIVLTACKVLVAHSFLDYVLSGTQINFTVAVDFTASNGDPRQPNSLHYIHPHQPNEYTKAMWAVGQVVQDYDSDKQFPGLGFGARIPPHFTVSHEFALNFNMDNPFCSGVSGLVSAYQSCLNQVQLYGPTNFAPVINHVARFAEVAHKQANPQNYFVLLILTDGVVTDLPDTCRAIVRASHFPMSIIIVGVGSADFSNMIALDGDGDTLKSPDGTPAIRDIVQFVPFHKYKQADASLLAKEVLAEVPEQLTEYFRLHNIPPRSLPPR